MMMSSARRFAGLAFAALALPLMAFAQAGAGSVVQTERVRAELMVHAPEGVAPGKKLWLGLQLKHQPEWHTYWKNPGDSGLPTSLQWTLPPGVVAGDIDWPVPKKLPLGHLANYGYEGTVLLPVPLTITPEFKPSVAGDLPVKVKATWLVCRQECIPEDGEFAVSVPTRSSTALNAAAFQASFDAQPKPVRAASEAQVAGNVIKVKVAGLPAAVRGQKLDFFPEVGEVIEPAAPWTQAWQGDTWTAEVPLSAHRSASPAVLPVVLTAGGQGWRAEPKVSGEWASASGARATANVSPALAAALRNAGSANGPAAAPTSPTPSLTLLAALLGALLGGLILNLMPCVFPILAIKVVGFTRHAGDRRGHRMAGLAYTGGVVASFAALGGLMLALRAAGEQLGWGFQLQSPSVVAALAALFTLIGLNLAGVFQFGNIMPSRIATLQARHPAGDAFLSGILAVAIASPCTAPFMGASLGFAIGMPAAQALLVFIAIGIGMAVPYLAASWVPAVARALPRPGPWMDTFRKLMAFPMFATVAWLVWVLGQQSGIDGAGALLVLLVALSMVAWAFTLAGRARTVMASIAIAVLALIAWSTGSHITDTPPAAAARAESGPWQPWEPGRVEQLVASGDLVFVDFTAAWCVTCQYNKQTTLSRDDVLGDFAAKKITMLRADWTRRDPAITEALAQLGRNGVPVYAFYKKGRPPVVLSEVLSPSEVRSAIAAL
jgi:thiol:disulfide interchange protein/DsbC/DsbD-like thiol-disulfide interchange protein